MTELRVYRSWPAVSSWTEDQRWVSETYVRAVSEEMAQTPEPHLRKMDTSKIEDVSSMLEKLLIQVNQSSLFIAEVRGERAGYFLGMIKECLAENPDRIGYINGLYVVPECRRSRIGQELLEAGRRWFRKEGISFVELYVALLNQSAKRFWEKNGYRVVEEVMAENFL